MRVTGKHLRILVFATAAAALLAACNLQQPPGPGVTGLPSALPPTTAAPPTAAVPTSRPPTAAPATATRPATAVPATTPSAVPTARPTTAASATAEPTESTYVDNRSDPWALLASFASAVNRREYLRAYSYWEPGAPGLPPYDQFAQGYAGTVSLQVNIASVSEGVGTGNIYYGVPLTMVATTTGGARQAFAGCYQLHLGRPSIQGTPPFRPLALSAGQLRPWPEGSDPAPIEAAACAAVNVPPGEPTASPPPTPGGVRNRFYVDDRSAPVDVLVSLFNAVNRKEYVRAYWYWEPDSPQRLPFEQFQQGYATTDSVELTTGQVKLGAAAGNLYADVPAALVAHDTSGGTTTYVGCYRLHLGQPANQGVPPFQPWGIQSGNLHQVPNGSDLNALLQQQQCGE